MEAPGALRSGLWSRGEPPSLSPRLVFAGSCSSPRARRSVLTATNGQYSCFPSGGWSPGRGPSGPLQGGLQRDSVAFLRVAE